MVVVVRGATTPVAFQHIPEGEQSVGYWSVHTHSKYSAKDALPTVNDLVSRAADLDFEALGLTDHGTAAGIFELYKHSREAGIKPVPGVEMYVAVNRHMKKPFTRHMGVVATTSTGWNNLIGLVNHSMRVFRYKPVVDFDDLARFADNGMLDGLSVLTGCFFGVLNSSLGAGDLTARNLLITLQDWFDGRVFVEVQNHHINTADHSDIDLIKAMRAVADEVGAPLVVTNDAHYTLRSHAQTHNMLKFLSSWDHDDPDSAVFPGDGYWLCSTAQMKQRFDADVWADGVAGLDALLDGYDITVPALDEFRVQMPKVTNRDPVLELTQRINVELDRRLLGKEYGQRAAEEMKVIGPKGFAEYLLLVASITDWMTSEGIAYLARGSASGSVVCWLLGITQVDPLEFNLRFDRFLSIDRIKPPDIDLDVEHNRRDEALERLERQHPSVRIGNWRSVRLSEEDPHKGSLWVEWQRAASKGQLRLRDEQRDAILADLSKMGTYAGMGKHAAGLVVAPDVESVTHLPMQWMASSSTMVTALDMHNIEDLGFIKVDLLGSRTLTAVASSLRTLGMSMEQIPLDDKKVFARMSSGKTMGIFQLQGWSAQAGCRQLKPRKFLDVVHAVALFRPAAQKSGATGEFIATRAMGKKSVRKDRHPLIKRHTDFTYGVLVYQEQVLGILGEMGMDAAELSTVLKAVKASNANVGNAEQAMAASMSSVVELARKWEMSDDDINWLRTALIAYSEYGFNLSHAVSYARIAYITGWLLVNHPAVYWAALISQYTHKADDVLLMRKTAIEVDKLTFIKAHVNYSKIDYVANETGTGIIESLTTIHGLGEKACAEIEAHAPYTSVLDLAERCNSRVVTGSLDIIKGHTPDASKGVIKNLYEAGALEALPVHPEGWKDNT